MRPAELFGETAPGSGAKSAIPLPPDAALTALTARLHVSTTRAGQVLDALNRMANPGRGSTRPAAFAALGHSLGKTSPAAS